ncbi:hypothetical protein Axi01nite_44070 [Actinoplanes xinjiangensis]|nr:hypothetical protein Axi01nite_44070 [Actinoplanes xinjiangensis]
MRLLGGLPGADAVTVTEQIQVEDGDVGTVGPQRLDGTADRVVLGDHVDVRLSGEHEAQRSA